MSMVLYDHPDSPNCRKVRLLVCALGLRVEREVAAEPSALLFHHRRKENDR